VAEEMTGGCACGRIRYTATVHDYDAYLCHCRMCQRTIGSVAVAFKNVKWGDVQWTEEPDWYESSPFAKRPFCSHCGTSFGFRFNEGSDKMDLTVASFDDPSRFVPKHHFGAESINRRWLNTEGLPEIATSENPFLVDKWMQTTGKLPE
jgi:hypothetical protein